MIVEFLAVRPSVVVVDPVSDEWMNMYFSLEYGEKEREQSLETGDNNGVKAREITRQSRKGLTEKRLSKREKEEKRQRENTILFFFILGKT